MGIEPTSPAWKAGTLPLSYSREYRAAPTIPKARAKTQGPRAAHGANALGVLRGLLYLGETLVVEKDPADGDRRAGAVQVGHESAADLRVRGKLAQMKPTHPAGGHIPNQKRPPGKAASGQERDQLIGRARRPFVSGARSVLMRRRLVRSAPSVRPKIVIVAGLGDRHPPLSLRGRKLEVVLRADVQPARSRDSVSVVEMHEVPSGFPMAPALGALETPLRAGGSLKNGHVQNGPPLRAPTPPRGGLATV